MSLADHDRAPAPVPLRPRHAVRRVLLVLLGLVLVLAVAAALFLWTLGRTFDARTQVLDDAFPAESARPAAGSAQDRGTTVLVLGADTQPGGRADVGVEGQRADTVMLVHLPEGGGEAYVLSILRDTWVPIPGVGEAKINAALDLGGVPLMVETVEDLVGTRVDQVAEVDFAGFQALTDALGGVTVDVPQDFVSNEGMTFEQGPEHMDGERALEFVRERKAFADGDFQRVANQRTYLRAALERALAPQTLLNPFRLHAVVEGFSPYLVVSEGLDAGWIAGLAPDLAGLSAGNLHLATAPQQGLGWSPDGQSVVVPDLEAMAGLGEAISEDNLGGYLATLSADDQ
ncbi:LCP family protein [Kocuria oceani]|uniref:LCP family protein n=1 Tax=Kocuria oceani TaxID=988827 RepID=A0ABV9TLT1_9MICC|nr:LCP family protein [Kocuria oceani]